LIFDVIDEKSRQLFEASNSLSAALYQIVSKFGNSKAHVHRLTEASLHRIDSQNMSEMIGCFLRQMVENAETIIEFLVEQGKDTTL